MPIRGACGRACRCCFLLAVIWSHTWLGAWMLLPLGLLVVWVWLNPRIFPPPADINNWASKATFGERIWLGRRTVPIPERHARMAQILTVVAALGTIVAVAGAIWNDLVLTGVGACVAWFGKMWFCDRMVWLYEDMKDRHPRHRASSRGHPPEPEHELR